jgi:hypothetical protein
VAAIVATQIGTNNANNTAATGLTITLAAAASAGLPIVVNYSFRATDTPTVTSITDTATNTYSLVTSAKDPGTGGWVMCYWCQNPSALSISDTITISLSATVGGGTFGAAWQLDQAAQLVASAAAGTNSNGNNPSITSGANIPADAIVFGVAHHNSTTNTFTEPANWTEDFDSSASNRRRSIHNKRNNQAGGSALTWTPTQDGTPAAADWAAIIVAFEATAGGSQSLTPSLFTNDQTFYGPAITVGSVALTPSLFTNTQTFYEPTVEQAGGTQFINAPLFTDTQTFYAPTITTGAVTLTPDLFTNTQTFFAPTIEQGATPEPEEEAETTGGASYLAPHYEQLSRADKKRRKRLRERQARFEETIRQTYRQIKGIVEEAPEEAQEAVAEVRAVIAAAKLETAPEDAAGLPEAFDFSAVPELETAVARLQAVLAELQAAQKAQQEADEDDEMLMLLM